MKYNPVGAKDFSPLRKRRTIRLKGYDYSSPGAYFVTICTRDRELLFGDVIDGEMVLNAAGKIAQTCWYAIAEHFPNVDLDAFIIMPNHIHGIIMLNIMEKNVGAKDFSPLQNAPTDIVTQFRSPSKTIGSVVRGFKIGVTKWFRRNTNIYMVWQRNYYEHIIRNEDDLNRIRKYIIENPLKWSDDRYFITCKKSL